MIKKTAILRQSKKVEGVDVVQMSKSKLFTQKAGRTACQVISVVVLLVVVNLCILPNYFMLPSVLLRCWLGGMKGIRLLKTELWGTGVVICLEQGANNCIWSS